MPNWKKLVTSGSSATLNSLYVTNGVTGSLLGTASWANNATSAGNTSTIDINVFGSPVDSYILFSNVVGTTGVAIGGDADLRYNASTNTLTATTISATRLTGSLFGTSSWSTTSSYALNGGVTQIIAGTNISISSGTGSVTINSTATSGGTGTNTTASFSNSSTWTFTHGLNSRYVIVHTLDNNHNQIVPQNITLTDNNTATITFNTAESGYAIASLGGVGTSAATASYVNTLNQSILINGDVTANIFEATNNGNGTNFKVGDDAWIGDINTADTIGLKGQQNATKGYIKFGSGSSNPTLGSNGTNTLELTGTLTLTSGSITLTTGSILMPNRPAFRVYGSSVTGISATTTITSTHGTTVDYNKGNYYNNTTGIFTAPITGLYHVYFNCRTQTAGGQQVIIYKNTSTAQMMWETNTNSGHFGVSSILNLAANDTLEAKVTVGTVQFDANDNWGAAYIG